MHSNGKILFSWRKNCLSKFLWCADDALMMCFRTRRQVFIVWRSSLKKMISPVLTQIVHSNGKMLFFQPKDCLSKFLWCTTHVKLFFRQGKVCVHTFVCISKYSNGMPKVARKALNIGEVWNPVCCHGNKTVEFVVWSTFSRILLQRIKHFWYKLAEISFFIIFDQNLIECMMSSMG